MFKYRDLYEKIKEDIATGRYKAGDKLPTETLLTGQGYSRNTVRQALAMLEEEGLISRKRGSGSTVNTLYNNRQRSGNVALLTIAINAYIFPDNMKGLNDGLKQWATPMLYETRGHIDEERRILLELMDKGIDGLIVNPISSALPNPNIPLYKKLQEQGIPIVFMFSSYDGLSGCVTISNDDKVGGRMAVQHLYEQGKRNIGGIFIPESVSFHQRYEGYCQACEELHIPLESKRYFWLSSDTYKQSDDVRRKIARITQECDGIVCVSDMHAALVVETLAQADIRVPEDVAVVGFDNSFVSEYATPPITSLDGDPYSIGYLAAQSLKSLLDGKAAKPAMVPWQLIHRQSS